MHLGEIDCDAWGHGRTYRRCMARCLVKAFPTNEVIRDHLEGVEAYRATAIVATDRTSIQRKSGADPAA